MKHTTCILAISIGCILTFTGCGHKNYAKADLTDAETSAPKGTITVTSKTPETTKTDVTNDQGDQAISHVTASIHTYKEGNVSIQYPVVSNLDDPSIEEKINNLFKSNALEILKAYSIDPQKDSLSIECRINSSGRKRTTAVYTGLYSPKEAAHPTHLFFTNTIDMAFAKDVGLSDYVDPYTLAGYVLSDDCQFYNASPEAVEYVKQANTDNSLESYTQLFQNADFPIEKKTSDGTSLFPECFSYEDEGTILFSLPVPHAVGDYILVKYTPETK